MIHASLDCRGRILHLDRPRIAGTDEGVWRRLRLIPFLNTVPVEDRDTHLPDKLRNELAGILRWCVDGWFRYKSEGMTAPKAVVAASSEYRTASDMLGAFIAEACEVGDYFTAHSSELYTAYCTWCEDAGERARSQRELGMRLAERGFEQARIGKSRRWRGLRITGVASDASDPALGLSTTRSNLQGAYTGFDVHTSHATPASDYRKARDGVL